MKRFVAILVAFCVASLHSEYPPALAKVDRIISIEEWTGRGNEALVWAVQPGEITIYRIDSGEPDQILDRVRIGPQKAAEIRGLVAKIDPADRGNIWFDPKAFDGILLRFSFTQDGDLRNDRIEEQNCWVPRFADIIKEVSAVVPEKWKIRFHDLIQVPYNGYQPNVKRKSIAEYYRSQ